LEDPYLHADDAIGSHGFGEAVVNVCAQRVQGHPAFAVPLRPRNFCTVQPAPDFNLHAFRADAHRVGHRTFHRPAEHDAAFQLLRYAFSNQLRIQLRLAYFADVDAHVMDAHAQQLRDLGPKLLDIFTLLADDDSRASRENRDVRLLRGTLDVDSADGCILQLFLHERSEFVVRAHIILVPRRVGIPPGRPVLDDA